MAKELELANPREILGYRLITKSIERIADHAVSIAKEVLELKGKINPETLEMISKMTGLSEEEINELK